MANIKYVEEGDVTVTCRDGRVEKGTHVVSTLPLSVLTDGVRGTKNTMPCLPYPCLNPFTTVPTTVLRTIYVEFSVGSFSEHIFGSAITRN